MKIDFQKVKNNRWYRQESASKIYFALGPGMGAVKQLNGGQGVFFYFSENYCRGYYSEDYFFKLAEKQFLAIKQNPKYLPAMHKKWTGGNAGLLKLIDEIRGLDVKSFAGKKLLVLNKKLGWLAQSFWDRPIFMDIFDVHAHELIVRELKIHGLDVEPKDLSTLLAAKETSFVQKYHLALRRLPSRPKPRDLQKIIDKFYYIKCSYAQAEALTLADIKKDLNQEQKTGGKKIYSATKSRLYKKYSLSGWPKRMLESFAFLALWREERKMILQKTVFALNKLGQEIAIRSNLPWKKVALCLPYKIDRLPVPKKLIDSYQRLCQKNYLAFYNPKSKKIEFLDFKTCQKLMAFLELKKLQTELFGQVACRGKVTGPARLISGETDFDKFRPGDILITSMTRPEFMPLLRRAKGIITDEGGITCHAAIVSRELKIPCVTGTKNATRVFKNNDKILLDANTGSVKKI